MEGNYFDVYNQLNMIDKLDGSIYSSLLSIYGENIVNRAIEQLINEKTSNLEKFEYYISKISSYDNMVSKDSFVSYMDEVSLIPTLSRSENIKLVKEVYLIINQIKNMCNFCCEDDIKFFEENWVSDNINKFMRECNDKNKLYEMKELYDQFLNKRNKLVEGNIRLVLLLAKQFNTNDTVFIESIQLGNMGLMRAIEKFSPEYNVTFSTYAYYWIRQFITRGIYNVLYPYSIPVNKVTSYYMLKRIEKEFYNEYERDASNEEIALKMDVQVEMVELLKTIFKDPLSLYETYGTDEEKDTMLIEFIEDENPSLYGNLDYLELVLSMKRSIDLCLNEQEKIVIRERYGFNGGISQTLNNIGKKIGRTKERVRQIEIKALRKLNVGCNDLKYYM